MFGNLGGGPPKMKTYCMEYVPLRIGVKIRPDDEYYDKKAQDSFKEASLNLNNLAMVEDLGKSKDFQNKGTEPVHHAVKA